MRNKNRWRSVTAALCSVLFLTACSSSDNDFNINVTGDCAITSAVMGDLRRTIHTQNAAGRDTSYVTTVQGNYFPLHIDHLKREIYNTDSLPKYTHINKVTFSSLTADGYIYYRVLGSDRDTLYSGKDSIDFTQPRLFTVIAADGNAKRTYTMRITARNSNAQEFTWRKLDSGNTDIAALETLKSFMLNDRLTVLGTVAGRMVCLSRDLTDEGVTTTTDVPLLDASNPLGIQQLGNTLFILTDNGLCSSTDGINWEQTEADQPLARLLGAGSAELYAAGQDGKIYRSTDGNLWTAESTDESTDLLPEGTTYSAYTYLRSNLNLETAFLIGFSGDEPRTWKKIIDHTGLEVYPWSYYPVTEETDRVLPRLESFCLMNYDDHLLAWGKQEGNTVSYVSGDGGHSWERNYIYTLPDALNETPSFTSSVAPDGKYIWTVCPQNGEIWKGKLNKLSDN